ncbi:MULTISPECIES: helix-turn-helix domain-containing protein [unclassified Sphingomonas]|uniref:helix-turn-helix domain-containing protein n=1 Tax=unclassified Sphingomonas TaxID=196159 RepID=UPI0009E855AF|nr:MULTISPECIES: helix-turn-helix domain-containing protein [unclassified Sphingomonas]
MQKLLTTVEAAPLFGVTPKTAENWRCMGVGPAFVRAGRRVVYDPADIAAWIAKHRATSTSQPAAA